MAQSNKRETKASGSLSSHSDICSREGRKSCNSPRKVLDEDDQGKQPNLSDKQYGGPLETRLITDMRTNIYAHI